MSTTVLVKYTNSVLNIFFINEVGGRKKKLNDFTWAKDILEISSLSLQDSNKTCVHYWESRK